MLVLDILNDFRGEALPSRDKKKQKKKTSKYWHKTFLLKHMLRFSI